MLLAHICMERSAGQCRNTFRDRGEGRGMLTFVRIKKWWTLVIVVMQRIVEDCRHTVGVFKVPLTPVRKPFWIKGPMRPFENRKLPNLTARIFWNNLPMVLACYAMSLSSGHLPLENDLTTTIRDWVHWPCTCRCGNSLVHMKGLKTWPGQPTLVVYTTTNVCIHLVWGSNSNVHLLLCSKIAHQFCCVEVRYQLQMTIVRIWTLKRLLLCGGTLSAADEWRL